VNQYTNRTVPGYLSLVGTAGQDANVTIISSGPLANTVRQGDYFWGELAGIDNSSYSTWLSITNMAVINDGATDIVSQVTGGAFIPQTPEIFRYDSDGNLTNDGHWIYQWDAENRLVRMDPFTVRGPQVNFTFTYDWKGGRIMKIASPWAAPQVITRFVYDGWNLVAELGSAAQYFAWGLDLSGSPQGAGGVGGLLWVSQVSNSQITNHLAAFDGNGNVAALINASDGTISAQYEYGPFGELIRATGPMAFANALLFSTKFYDWETGFYYYGYRYYNPSTGRWLSRDPMGERGGANHYGFLRNCPASCCDRLGLCRVCGTYAAWRSSIRDLDSEVEGTPPQDLGT